MELFSAIIITAYISIGILVFLRIIADRQVPNSVGMYLLATGAAVFWPIVLVAFLLDQ